MIPFYLPRATEETGLCIALPSAQITLSLWALSECHAVASRALPFPRTLKLSMPFILSLAQSWKCEFFIRKKTLIFFKHIEQKDLTL